MQRPLYISFYSEILYSSSMTSETFLYKLITILFLNSKDPWGTLIFVM